MADGHWAKLRAANRRGTFAARMLQEDFAAEFSQDAPSHDADSHPDPAAGLRASVSGGYTVVPTECAGLGEEGEGAQSFAANGGARSSLRAVKHEEGLFPFVEAGWFQAFAAGVIVLNVVTMVLEADDPDRWSAFVTADQFMLCFYIFELCCRALHFRGRFLSFGPPLSAFTAWNCLDVVVVLAGVWDEWLVPLLLIQREGNMQIVLQSLRSLRLFRALKIIRICLEADLTWTESPMFQSFIGVAIFVNSILMGMETDIKWDGWFIFEQVLLTIYCFELVVRLRRFGRHFLSWHNPDIVWNVLDLSVVISSTMDTWVFPLMILAQRSWTGGDRGSQERSRAGAGQVVLLVRMLRLLRILRLIKLVKCVRPLYILVTGVVCALQGVTWVLVLTVTVLYALGIMATRLIGHGLIFPPGEAPPDILVPFRNVPNSMFTLFRIMSGAPSGEEELAMDELMHDQPGAKFTFVFFMVTSSWTLLSILTAVVSENMISTTRHQEEELRLAFAEEERHMRIEALRELFQEMDQSHDGVVDEQELSRFLADRQNATNVAHCCRVPVCDVKDMLRTLYRETDSVSMSDFTECLMDVGKVATEKTIMRLEAQISANQRRNEQLLSGLERLLQSQFCEQRSVTTDVNALIQKLVDELPHFEGRGMEAIGGLSDNLRASGTAVERLRNDVRDLAREVSCGSDKRSEALDCHDVAIAALASKLASSVESLGRLRRGRGEEAGARGHTSISTASTLDKRERETTGLIGQASVHVAHPDLPVAAAECVFAERSREPPLQGCEVFSEPDAGASDTQQCQVGAVAPKLSPRGFFLSGVFS